MKKIYLHFKNYNLGFLTQENNAYIWVPNENQIKLCFSRYDGAIDMFFLNIRKSQLYQQIPYHYSDYLASAERNDLIKKAKILLSDSDFDKLYKLATLKFFNNDFYISV